MMVLTVSKGLVWIDVFALISIAMCFSIAGPVPKNHIVRRCKQLKVKYRNHAGFYITVVVLVSVSIFNTSQTLGFYRNESEHNVTPTFSVQRENP